MPLSTGQVLNNRYRIVKLLGQGGFGAVYRAWDINLEKPCALKENLDTSPEAQRQFKHEARLLSDLSHPNLPRVIDHFILPGQGQYLVMDYVEGEDLEQSLQQQGGPLPEAQAVTWITQVCDALSYMHNQKPSVIHRDIKPANIKITPQGRAMLVDFGIAKIYDPGLRTTVGARAVTPGYSPIEQYTSSGSTDPRTDIYALGATLYTLLTGHAPPEAPERNLGLPVVAPRAVDPALSPQVDGAVMKALEVQPGDRWQSAAEFKQALSSPPAAINQPVAVSRLQTAAYGGQTAAQPLPASSHPQAPGAAAQVRNRRWLFGLVGVIAAAILLWAAFKPDGGGGEADFPATLTALAKVEAQPTETARPTRTLLPTNTLTLTPTSTPTQTPLPTSTPAGYAGVILIPAGEFQMGSEYGESNEKPKHTVYLDVYYLDIYEVTNARYMECVSAGGCSIPDGGDFGSSSYVDHPVVYVNWNQARSYCQWRGGDLPTEAQWEKAARGGLVGKKYPWGNEEPVCQKGATNGAKFDDDAGCNGTGTELVGSYSANGYGLYDMTGNVWEWVLDWYQETFYANSPTENPTGPASGSSRVLRGGSWYNLGYILNSAYRARNAQSFRSSDVGIRCSYSLNLSNPEPTATETPISTSFVEPPNQLVDEKGITMGLVPAGEFQMGSQAGNNDEKPVHTVYLDAYYMDIYEVSNRQYVACVHTGSCSPPEPTGSHLRSIYYGDAAYKDYPVINVDWSQARAYCQWRGGDLPTEAQWEKAARGGLVGKKYPWGDEAPACQKGARNGAKFDDNSGCNDTDTEPVGSYSANGYGLYDMAGNVWEWVLDWYQETFYTNSPFENPTGPASGEYRVLRGGSWHNGNVADLRVSVRAGVDPPSYSNNVYGFRCVRSP